MFRLYEKETNKAIADVVTLFGETIPTDGEYEIFDPQHTWKRKKISNFYAVSLLEKIFDKGTCVYEVPNINDVRDYCAKEVGNLWDEVKRLENPHEYYVDLSQKLWDVKNKLLNEKQ